MSFRYSITRSVAVVVATGVIASPAFADDGWDTKIFGRAQYDYTIADADNANLDIQAGELRTARIGVSGKNGNVAFKLEFATDSGGEVSVTDGYAEFTPGGGNWTLRAGQFKTPNSLDEDTSGRFGTTFERAAFTDAFEFDRRLGIAARTSGDRHTFMAGLFAANLNDTAQDEGYAAAARGTYNPVKTDDMIVHLGASVRYREKGDDQANLRYRQRPYAHIPGRIISTGSIAESDSMIALEGAAISGPLWVAAEYALLNADTVAGGDTSLRGGYAEAGYFFGGKRGYKGGKFDRPKVDSPVTDGGNGAFAIAARYDVLDLSDGPVDGGELDTIVLAFDWFPTSKTRLGINLFNSDAGFGTSTSGLDSAFATALTAGASGDEATGATVRVQFDF